MRSVTSKVVEASDPQDLSQAVTDFIDEINRIREEEAEALGYDSGQWDGVEY